MKLKITRKHISIVFKIKNTVIFNFYFEPKLLQESLKYKYPNFMGLWLIIFNIWVV